MLVALECTVDDKSEQREKFCGSLDFIQMLGKLLQFLYMNSKAVNFEAMM